MLSLKLAITKNSIYLTIFINISLHRENIHKLTDKTEVKLIAKRSNKFLHYQETKLFLSCFF